MFGTGYNSWVSYKCTHLNIALHPCHCRVDLEFPKIEVRFQNLTVESFVHVGSRALPTIPNFIFNVSEVSSPQFPFTDYHFDGI